ncbi:MAG: RNA methyltransferase [Bdellovibrio sp.]
MSRFFVVTPLDFEQRVLTEMQQVWPYLLGKDAQTHALPFPEVDVLQGGLEFEADLFTAVQLNFFLKSANRILLRMTSFKARDLPKFYQKFKSLPWREYLPHAQVQWEIAAQKSRLNNEKRLQDSAEQALKELFSSVNGSAASAVVTKDEALTIYIRMDQDLCTISLDTTGEHLHKRGWSVLKGEAPLRETLASFALQAMIADKPPASLAKVTLMDPMMGAGTFLTEARSLYSGQFRRPYAFQKWKKAPKLFLSPHFAGNYEMTSFSPFKEYVGRDIQEKMLPVVRENFAEVEKQIADSAKASASSLCFLSMGDALSESRPAEAQDPLWLVVNPPYGERLPTAVKGVQSLTETLCRLYRPEKLGILYPEKERIRPPMDYQIEGEHRLNNGGLRCLFTILTKSK